MMRKGSFQAVPTMFVSRSGSALRRSWIKEFTAKVAVVTGAASGIGLALAHHCLGLGMRVMLADVNAAGLSKACTELAGSGADIRQCRVDVADARQVEVLAEKTFDEFGQVDLLFNNAGVLETGVAWQEKPQVADRLFRINVLGVVHGLQSFVPPMLAQGTPSHIVNTASAAVILLAPMLGLYTASKMAVRGLTETLRLELKAMNAPIKVSMLCPGPVLTAMTADAAPGDAQPHSAQDSDLAAMNAAAGGLEYMDPAKVADITFEAIQEDRFWIFTHPEMLAEDLLPRD